MKERTVRFKYKFPEDYNPLYVNGAYGGVGPRGELIANFFLERQALPVEEQYTVSEKGRLSESPVSRKPEDVQYEFIRFVQAGVAMRLEDAKRIRDWLDIQIKVLEERQGMVEGG